ncbi:MAG TPA: hypothetical protein VE863_01105 [Pyrinomonadaceae bacterium]|jgi:hypothetical protein|nr:hypothetical protein [Pyrinomonadaceae bacterium]
MKQATNEKAERRRAETDRYHLNPAFTPVPNEGLCRVDADGEERYRTKYYRQNNRWRAGDNHEWNDWYEVTDEGRHCDNHSAA